MKRSEVFQFAVPVLIVVTVVSSQPVEADKDPGAGFFNAGGGMPAPVGKSYLQPGVYNGRPIGVPSGTSSGVQDNASGAIPNTTPGATPNTSSGAMPPSSSTWSNSNPGGSLVIPSGTVMAFPASSSYVWNAATHPLPLNGAAPKNLELGTWTIKDKSKNTIVGTWTWIAASQNFSGSYTNGVVETLRVDEFTGSEIAISGYNSYGLAVDFVGTRTSPNSAIGIATAHAAAGPFTWPFEASW